ncbi:MAG TPA: uL15 family ribosomal protein [Firmicutes bacterium]|nr:uL15 family ribosomal protein [Bacillota bacterium]
MREQKHRLIRTFTAVALMFTAFFAALFGFLTLDRADARAAGEAVGIRAQLQSGKDVYTGMTHAQLGDVLLVTLVDAEGQQVGDALEYDEIGTDGFTVAGDISVASGSLSQSQRFTVTYGEYETSVNLTVQVNRIKEIKDIVFEPDETIYSNSDTYQMGSYITSFVGVNYAGEEIPLTSESIMMTGTFVPDKTTTYDGSIATFSKEMTVRYSVEANGTTATAEGTVLVEGIHALTPTSISISSNEIFDAYSTLEENGNAGKFNITINYPTDINPMGNPSVTLSLADSRYFNVRYGDASGNVNGSDGQSYTSFVYDASWGTIGVSYTENGTTVQSPMRRVRVSRIEVASPGFRSDIVYDYTVSEGLAVGKEQQAEPLQDTFNAAYMEITGLKKGEQILDTFTKTYVTVTDAGDYTVTITLTNDAYIWQGSSSGDNRSVDVTFTVAKANLNELAVALEGESLIDPDTNNGSSSHPYTWNHGDSTPAVVVSNNYGGAQIVYHYNGDNGVSDASDMPTARGDYTLYVTAPESDNFNAGESGRIYFRIGQRELKLPSFKTAVYNGVVQSAENFLEETSEAWETYQRYCDITGDYTQKDVNTYTITFTIKESERNNAKWKDKDDAAVSDEFEIVPLKIVKPTFNESESVFTEEGQSRSFDSFNQIAEGQDVVESDLLQGGVFANAIKIEINQNGSVLSGGVSVTNAGTYTISLSLNDATNLVWAEPDAGYTYSWTVLRKGLTVPTAPNAEYVPLGSSSVTLDGFDADIMSASTEESGLQIEGGKLTAEDAGPYKLTVTLTNLNYCWGEDGSDVDTTEVTWKITPFKISVPEVSGAPYTYNENVQEVLFDEETYADDAYEKSDDLSATDAGNYFVTFTLKENTKGETNYVWLDNDAGETAAARVGWTIMRKAIEKPTAPSVVFNPDGPTAGQLSGYVSEDTVGTVMTASSDTATVDPQTGALSANAVNDYTIKIELSHNYVWGSEAAEPGENDPYELTWQITRKGVPYPVLADKSYEYNAKVQTVELDAASQDWLNKAYSFVSGYEGQNADEYTVEFRLDGNYCWIDDSTGSTENYQLPWTIARFSIDKPTDLLFVGGLEAGNTYNYDETITATPDAITDTPDGEENPGYTLSGEKTANSVKTDGDYTVTLKPGDNYQWTGGGRETHSLTWNVLPLKIALPESEDATLTYSSELQTVTLTGWTSGVEGKRPLEFAVTSVYTYETDNATGKFSAENADTYTISLKLSDPVNFAWADGTAAGETREICTVEIKPLVLSVNDWSGEEDLVFDNRAKQPVVSGSNVIGGDEVSFQYKFTETTGESTAEVEEARHAGSYTVSVSGLEGGDAHNYTLSGAADISCSFKIEKFTLVTGEVISFQRKKEFNNSVWTPEITLNVPKNLYVVSMSGIIGYEYEDDSSTTYNTYWVIVTLKNTRDYRWSITLAENDINRNAFDHPASASDQKEGLTDDDVIWMWYQITKTTLPDVNFHFEGNITEWEYGTSVKAPVYDTSNLANMTPTIYYYGSPADPDNCGGWTFDDVDSASTEMPKYAGTYTAHLRIETSNQSDYETATFEIEFTIDPAPLTLELIGSGYQDGSGYTFTYGSVGEALVDDGVTLKSPGGVGEPDAFSALGVSYNYGATGDQAPINAGDYTVTVSISNGNYTLEPLSAAFHIDQKTLTVSVKSTTVSYGDDAPEYKLVYEGGWVGTDGEGVVKKDGLAFTYSGPEDNYASGSPVGTYQVLPKGLEADNYTFIYSDKGTLTVDPKKISIDEIAIDTDEPDGKVYDGTAVTVTPSSSGKLDKDTLVYVFTYTKGGTPVGVQSQAFAKDAGKWKVVVTLGEGEDTANYELADSNGYSKEFTIQKRQLTVKFAQDGYMTIYGEAAPEYSLTIGNFAGTEDEESLKIDPTFATRRDGTDYVPGRTAGNVGEYTVTVTSLGANLPNYTFTLPETTLNVEQREVSLAVSSGLNGNTKIYDALAVQITVTPSKDNGTDPAGLLDGDTLVYTYSYTWSGGEFAYDTDLCAKDAGEWTVTVRLGTGEQTANYRLTQNGSTEFSIAQKELTVTVTNSYDVFHYGDAIDTDRYSSEITGWAEAASDEEKQLLQVTGYRTEDYIPGSACASYTISPVLNTEELTNYSITIVTDELVVSPRHVTITVPDLDNIYYDENIGIDRVYEEAIAGGLSDLIDDGVRDIVTFTPSVTLQRDTAVGNYTVSGSKHNANYTVEFVYTGEGSSTYAIRAADMQEAVYEAYNGIYDSEAHAVLNTGYHVTTRNDQTATWYFRLSEEDEWETDLTLTDAGTYTVYFYIAAPNHNDYGSSTQNSEEYSFQVVIKQYELSIKADGTITYGYDFDTEKDYTLSYQYGAGSWTQERPFGESLREMGLADEGGNLLLTVAAGTYQIGMDAESYPITLGAGSVVFDTLNYNISLEEGVLTVARREITIHINDTKGENVGSTYGNPFNPVSAEVTSEEKIYAKDGAWNDLITLSVLGPYWGVPENPFYDYTANSDDQLRAPAGDDYVIVASLLDGTSVNYNITFTGSKSYEGIAAGQYEVLARGVRIELTPEGSGSGYWTYDGTPKGYVASIYDESGNSDIEEGVDFDFVYSYRAVDQDGNPISEGYHSNKAPTDVGYYRVTVSANNQNYELTSASTRFEIFKAEYSAIDLTQFLSAEDGGRMIEFSAGGQQFIFVYTYDGKEHKAVFSNEYLSTHIIGADDSSPTAKFADGTTGKINVRDTDQTITVNDVEYYYKEITITFTTASGNYHAPDDVTVYVAVTPLSVDVDWGETEYTYDSEDHKTDIKPVYRNVDDSDVTLAIDDGRSPAAFETVGSYEFYAKFDDVDNEFGNYVLSDDSEQFVINERQIYIEVSDDGMAYGDTAPAAQSAEGKWWNYAGGSHEFVDDIGIIVTAMIAPDGSLVSEQTAVGTYYLVAEASADAELLKNYIITFTGSKDGTYGTFTVSRREIIVTIGDVRSDYGTEMTTLTAQLAEGTRLSAADADAGPNGETLLLDNPVVRLEVEGGIDTATIVGSYVVFGTPLNDNYAVTFRGNTDHGEGSSNAGVYTVDAATFGEEDITYSGYGAGEPAIYDGNQHQALASYQLSEETAASKNGLSVTFYVTKTPGDTQSGIPADQFKVMHVSESGTYYFYIVAASGDTECYVRTQFAFEVEIGTATNELTDFSWTGLEYGTTSSGERSTQQVRFGEASLEGIYLGNGETEGERILDASLYESADEAYEAFVQSVTARENGAGWYYVKFFVAGHAEDGEHYDWNDQTFNCAFYVNKYAIDLAWTVDGEPIEDNSLLFTGEPQTAILANMRSEAWMNGFSSEIFTGIVSSGGTYGTDSVTGYPTITATTASEYSVSITLADPDNYTWKDSEDITFVFVFSIDAQRNSVTISINRTLGEGVYGWTYLDTADLDSNQIIGYAQNPSESSLFIAFSVTAEGQYVYRFQSTDGGGYDSSDVPVNAGSYKVTISVLRTENYGGASATAEFTIAPRAIDIPTFEQSSTNYNGEAQTNKIVNYISTVTWITGLQLTTGEDGSLSVTATNVGTYAGVVTIIDPNYVWNDEAGGTEGRDIVWKIEKGTPVLNGTISIENWTYGEAANEPSGVTVSGVGQVDAKYAYFVLEDGTYNRLDAVPSEAGVYYVAAYVEGTENYLEAWLGASGVPTYFEFTIEQAQGESIFGEDGSVTVSVSGTTYGEGLSVLVGGLDDSLYTIGYYGADNGGTPYGSQEEPETEAPANAGNYHVVVMFHGDKNYTAFDYEQTFDIARASFTSEISNEDWVYGEEEKTPVLTENPGSGAVTYYYKGTTNASEDYALTQEIPTQAGSYSVYAVIAETVNYFSFRTEETSFLIDRKSVDDTFAVTIGDWTYGQAKAEPQVSGYYEEDGQTVTYLYTGLAYDGSSWNSADAPENAGTYRLTVSVQTTANYYGGTAEQEFHILRATFVLTADLDGWTYNGTAEHEPTYSIGGSQTVPGGGSITYYYYGASNDGIWSYEQSQQYATIPTRAGSYFVVAVAAQTNNYERVESEPVAFEIARATYADMAFDMTGWTSEDGVYAMSYDGKTHAPVISALSVGLDGVDLHVEYSGSVTNVADGTVTRTATFSTTSGNYKTPEAISVRIRLLPVTVDVVWEQTQFTYNGSEQTVTAYYVDVDEMSHALTVTIGDGKQFCDVGTYSATASFREANDNYILNGTQTSLVMNSASLVIVIGNQSFAYSGGMPVLDQTAYTVQTAGSYSNLGITLTVSDMSGEWNTGTYVITGNWDNKNYSIEFRSGTLTITPAELTVEITLGDNLTYDGTAKSATVRITDGLAGGDSLNVTLVYSGTANNGTTWNSTEAPVSAGSYTVRARINATNYVLSDTGSSEAFTIARALIDKPTVDNDDTPFSVDTVKTGEAQNIRIPIDLSLIGVRGAGVGTGLVPNADNSISLQATDEGAYSVTVFLRDADNYAWSDGTTGELTLEWNIIQDGLDPIVWAMIGLASALGVELIILAAYFLSGGSTPKSKETPPDSPEGPQTPDDGNGDPESSTDAHSEGTAEDTPATENISAGEVTEGEVAVDETDIPATEDTSSGELSEAGAVDGGGDQPDEPHQSGRTVTASFAAPALFGLLAITAWQIAGVALLAAAVAALAAVEIVLFAKRSGKKQEEPIAEAEPVAEDVPPVTEEAPVEEVQPEPEEELVVAEAEEEELPEEAEPEEELAVAEAEEEELPEEAEPEEESEAENVGSIESGITIIDGRRILVRYNYSFRAKLIQAPEEIQDRFGQLMDEFASYPKVKTKESWKQVRVYSGRKTLASVLFKGRKLCVAYALDPKAYEDTKYHGLDMSEIKRYEKTPMLLKVISDRKLRYAKYLFAQVAAQNGLEQGEVVSHEFRLPYETTEALIEQDLVRVFSNKELSEDAEYVKADIATLIREKITLREAQSAMTDEVAAMYLEEEEEIPEEPVSEPAEQTEAVPEKIPEADVRTERTPQNVPVRKERVKKGIINIDTLSQNFAPHDVVTLELIKERKLISENVDSLKVLARGFIDKPLVVEAHDFSMDAVKMILLTGGRAVRKKK